MIAIDLSDQVLRAAQVSVSRGVPALAAIHELRLPGESTHDADACDALKTFFGQVLGNGRFKGRRVALHLPPETTVVFPVRFEPARNESVEAAMMREAAKSLPFPAEEALLDYPSLRPPAGGDNGYEAMVVAARRSDVMRYVSLARESGGTVELVEFPPASLLRIHRYLHGETRGTILLCGVGYTRTLIVAINPDAIVAYRNAEWGVGKLIHALNHDLGLGNEDSAALYMLRDHGLAYHAGGQNGGNGSDADMARPVYQLIGPLVDQLVHEVFGVMGFVRSAASSIVFEGLHLYGYGPCIRALDAYLSAGVNTAAHQEDPCARLGNGSASQTTSCYAPFAQVAGLAMRNVSWL